MGAPDQIPVAPGEGALEETEEEESPLEDIAIPTDPTRPVEIALDQVHPSTLSALNPARESDVEAALDQWRRTSRMEPLIVRRRPNMPNEFEVVVGIERLHAARRAQLREIPVLVRDLDDSEALKAGLAARLKGRHVSALTEATIYLQLMTEASQSTEQVAALVGKPAGHVASMVRILNLPQSVRGMLERGEITVLHARALLNAHNPEAIARQVVAQRLDIYQTEQLVRSSRQGADTIRSQDVLDEADIDADEAFAAEDGSDLGEGTAERQPSHEEVTERKEQPSLPPAAMAEPEQERRQGRTAGSSATTIPFPEGGRGREAGRESAEEDNASTELLERHLSQLLGLKVSISERDNMGIMAFHYTDRDQLSRVIARLNRSVDQ
jgi:ParB family chromosome partitioning protein